MNIIQIRNRDINAANQAFAEFMDKTERFLNDKTKNNHSLYKKCSCFELENVVFNTDLITAQIPPSDLFSKR